MLLSAVLTTNTTRLKRPPLAYLSTDPSRAWFSLYSKKIVKLLGARSNDLYACKIVCLSAYLSIYEFWLVRQEVAQKPQNSESKTVWVFSQLTKQ